MRGLIFFLITSAIAIAQGPSGPPAMINGTVRSLDGGVIDNPAFEKIAIFADGTEIGRVGLELNSTGTQNYRFEIREAAMLQDAAFTVKLIRDSQEHPLLVPLEWLVFKPKQGSISKFDFAEMEKDGGSEPSDGSPPGPPAPYTTIYGTVRNLEGGIIDNPLFEQIAIFADGVELARIPLELSPDGSENYRFEIPNFSEINTAVFSVKLIRDSQEIPLIAPESWADFRPIQGDLSKIDFREKGGVTFEDLDGDRLPDEWERIQLARIGETDITLLNPNDDLDCDLLTNAQEYQIGTVATDFGSHLNFEVVREFDDGKIEISFDGVSGQSYFLQGSSTVGEWTNLNFSILGKSADQVRSLSPVATERVTILAPPMSFYRLGVQ